MKKNELKSGMVLTNYNDYLKNGLFSDLDIIKVYKYKSPCPFNALLENNNLDLIWEREEIKLTDKEIEVLKALKTLGYEFLARDEDTELYAYIEKPDKCSYDWGLVIGLFIDVNSDVFNFIKWEDKEPTNIDDLLKGE